MNEEAFDDLEILWISRFDYKKDWRLDPHAHTDFYQLIYCFEGKGTLLVANNLLNNFVSPTILFIPPQLNHGLNNIKHGLKTIDIKFKIKNKHLKQKCDDLIPIVSQLFGQEMLRTLDEIREEGQSKFNFYQPYCRLLLGLVLINLFRQNMQNKIFDNNIKETPYLNHDYSQETIKVIAFIEHNYKKKLTSKDFENLLNKSYRYISKKFISELKMTPVDYCRNYRIYKAQEYLRFSDKEIKEIYSELGFNTVHHFSNVFTKVVGIPPGKWKNEIRNGICQDIYFSNSFKNTLKITNK